MLRYFFGIGGGGVKLFLGALSFLFCIDLSNCRAQETMAGDRVRVEVTADVLPGALFQLPLFGRRLP